MKDESSDDSDTDEDGKPPQKKQKVLQILKLFIFLCIFSLFFSCCSIVHIVFSSVNRKHLQLQRMVAAVRMRMRMAAVRKVLMMSLQKLNKRRYFKFLDVGNMLLMLTSIN